MKYLIEKVEDSFDSIIPSVKPMNYFIHYIFGTFKSEPLRYYLFYLIPFHYMISNLNNTIS